MALPVVPGISRIVANDRSLMTCHGTNTYLIEANDGFVVLEPDPEDDRHLKDISIATHGQVTAILLSHTHRV